MVNALAVPIYSIALKMDPLFLGIALAAPRVIGAILDPVVGTVSIMRGLDGEGGGLLSSAVQ